jgi:Bardet-Biedl syndrome 7 protein
VPHVAGVGEQVYIVPKVVPKLCAVRTYKLSALSLHQRTSHTIDESRPLNTVTLTGSFSFADIHSWISICLPNVPSRVAEGEKVMMTFVSTFLATQLECSR